MLSFLFPESTLTLLFLLLLHVYKKTAAEIVQESLTGETVTRKKGL